MNTGQIYELDIENQTFKFLAEPIAEKSVFYLATDHQNHVWACIGNGAKGIFRILPEGQITSYTQKLNADIVVIREFQNEIYLAGKSKIFKYDVQHDMFEQLENVPDNLGISDLTFDKEGNIYLASSQGVFYQENSTFKRIKFEFEDEYGHGHNCF